MMSVHRWSGWPGAWCLDCGAHDPVETCISEHDAADEGVDHPRTPCPEPGSHRHDPYDPTPSEAGSMIHNLATTIWYAFLIVLGLWTAGALAGVVALGFCGVAGCR